MCDLCACGSKYYFELVTGWHLSRATEEYDRIPKNAWLLTRQNTPDFIFMETPTNYAKTDEGFDDYADSLDRFREQIILNASSSEAVIELHEALGVKVNYFSSTLYGLIARKLEECEYKPAP